MRPWLTYEGYCVRGWRHCFPTAVSPLAERGLLLVECPSPWVNGRGGTQRENWAVSGFLPGHGLALFMGSASRPRAPLWGAPLWGHCVGPLCGATVWGHCVGPRCTGDLLAPSVQGSSLARGCLPPTGPGDFLGGPGQRWRLLGRLSCPRGSCRGTSSCSGTCA